MTYAIILNDTILARSRNYAEICDILIGLNCDAQLREISGNIQ